MAKPTTNATPICIALSIILGLGIIVGLVTKSTLVVIIALLPSIIYEVYRTEGESTIWASWVMLGVVIAELACLFFNVKFDLASFLGTSSQYIGGYHVPLGDIKVVFPSLMAVLAVILFVRTAGIYTKWLSVLIFFGSFAIVWSLDPVIFQELLRLGINQGLYYLHF